MVAFVHTAYDVLLGREPESADIVATHASGTPTEVVRAIGASNEFHDRIGRTSPFYHYNARIEAEAIIQRHARTDLQSDPRYRTNFLGVRVDPKILPSQMTERGGIIEPVPIPANWHADIAEWAAALRAVELSADVFTMVELGCGWGCWMNNTGVAARTSGRGVQLIGVEGDAGHIAFARETCAANGFAPEDVSLHHGIAAARTGVALFGRQDRAGESWGLEPVFGADAVEQERLLATGRYEALPMIALADVIGSGILDLLHIDIQGGEADLVRDCLPLLTQRVAYLVIGTHSRSIEGRLFADLLEAGWCLEIERPAILALTGVEPEIRVDGLQGWRNPHLRPLTTA
ncbi:class I SAM-dependent methyltransferase [Methylobacterium sp. WL12]|nr:class I SAM-dependent methyltransferase [Methylobacterium sp. WL12]